MARHHFKCECNNLSTFLFLVPDGLKAPNVTVLNSSSVHVTWQEPALPNGRVVSYELNRRSERGVETLLFTGLGFSFTVSGLEPFTDYEFRVEARTSAGSGSSNWTPIKTFEDGKFETLLVKVGS